MTGLRFVLALWVILHHLTGKGGMLDSWASSLPSSADSIIRSGYLAVGSFFVLSGFVLSLNYAATTWDRRSLLRYAMARLARIYPVYVLSLLIVSPFILLESLPANAAGTKPALLTNYVLLLQGWSGNLHVGWNTPAWSLSCEVFFYLCFPLAAVFLIRTSWRNMLIVAALACALPTVLRYLGVPETWKPLIHVADFLTGILAARAFHLLSRAERNWMGSGHWLYIPAGLLAVLVVAFPNMLPSTLTLGGALRPLNALLIVGFALGGGMLAKWLSSRMAVALGKVSYSMYILHVPLLWWFKRFGPQMFGRLPAAPSAILYIGGVVAISAAVFRFVEEPASGYLRALSAQRQS